ncbi:hypothetical protein [Prochlorococcus marinus]|uniref:hypothetical protein n=1 Tax=Prochlorococcus marinus TaxID=1219 RepID=UPI001AD9C0BC|nr:hypothetical protein [Prochlorococcus marinus]MBO8219561.1 hypothetical protein [Prochlorococcus marinus CUG1416]MBW3051933.1 hypothetical protein [Prochlorococcus marinus str. MU1416]
MNNIKKISIYTFFYILIPILAVEIFAQYKFNTGYIYDNFGFNKSKSRLKILKAGLHEPNLNIINNYKKIYGDPKELKKTIFRTDSYGTIKPSSIERNKTLINSSIIFCGGSTTECVAVPEGERVTDKFTKNTKIPSINAGMSGKGLEGCINTINYFLNYVGKPKAIVIANNANTLPQFINKGKTSPWMLFTKNLFKKSLPGIYDFLGNLKPLFNNKNSTLKGNDFSSNQLAYELALSEGCCYGASQINRTSSSIKFEWSNKENKEGYSKFIKSLGSKLDSTLKRANYPKSKVYFFIEPNSFLNKNTAGVFDFRQFLFDKNGIKLSGNESASIIKEYDNKYSETLKKIGFKILQINQKDLKDNYFYDAAHLTSDGTSFIANFYSQYFINN